MDQHSVAYAAVLVGVLLLVALAVSALRGAPVGNLHGQGAHWGWQLVRAVLVPGLLALAVGALAFLLRHTAAVVGVVVGYLVVAQIVGNIWNPAGRFNLTTNLTALVSGDAEWYGQKCSTSAESGYSCTAVVHPITWHQGAVVIGLVTLALVGAAWLAFQRRDVT